MFIGSWKKQGNSRKKSTSASLTAKAFDCVDHRTLWKILKEMGIPEHLHVSWETWMQVKKQQLEPDMEQCHWFKTGKGKQGCILSIYSFNFYAEYIMWNAVLYESQAGIKIARRNINSLRYADDTTLMAESEEELRSFLMRVKEERGKLNWNSTFKTTKIMASGPITSWQI